MWVLKLQVQSVLMEFLDTRTDPEVCQAVLQIFTVLDADWSYQDYQNDEEIQSYEMISVHEDI